MWMGLREAKKQLHLQTVAQIMSKINILVTFSEDFRSASSQLYKLTLYVFPTSSASLDELLIDLIYQAYSLFVSIISLKAQQFLVYFQSVPCASNYTQSSAFVDMVLKPFLGMNMSLPLHPTSEHQHLLPELVIEKPLLASQISFSPLSIFQTAARGLFLENKYDRVTTFCKNPVSLPTSRFKLLFILLTPVFISCFLLVSLCLIF